MYNLYIYIYKYKYTYVSLSLYIYIYIHICIHTYRSSRRDNAGTTCRAAWTPWPAERAGRPTTAATTNHIINIITSDSNTNIHIHVDMNVYNNTHNNNAHNNNEHTTNIDIHNIDTNMNN